MPLEVLSSDIAEPLSSSPKFERSKTERQRGNTILAEEAAQIFDDRIPVQQKVLFTRRTTAMFLLSYTTASACHSKIVIAVLYCQFTKLNLQIPVLGSLNFTENQLFFCNKYLCEVWIIYWIKW